MGDVVGTKRLRNNVIAALEDAMAVLRRQRLALEQAEAQWRALVEVAGRKGDVDVILALARLRDALAQAEQERVKATQHVIKARNGGRL